MKAILRSWDKDRSYTDDEIEVGDDYDFAKGPYDPCDGRHLCE